TENRKVIGFNVVQEPTFGTAWNVGRRPVRWPGWTVQTGLGRDAELPQRLRHLDEQRRARRPGRQGGSVCCMPWLMTVSLGRGGALWMELERGRHLSCGRCV